MFVPIWIIFLFTGLVMAIFAVTWGIRAKQFDDQQRARFLPLVGMDTSETPPVSAKKHRAEFVAVWMLVATGVSALISGLVMALRHL